MAQSNQHEDAMMEIESRSTKADTVKSRSGKRRNKDADISMTSQGESSLADSQDGAGRDPSLRALIDVWAKRPDAQEAIESFRGRASLNGVWKRCQNADNILYKGQESCDKVLFQALLPNYYMFDSTITRGDSIKEFSQDDMLSYLHVKKRLLTLIFICVHNG